MRLSGKQLIEYARRKGYNPDELRWELYQAALTCDWTTYNRAAELLTSLGLEVPQQTVITHIIPDRQKGKHAQ